MLAVPEVEREAVWAVMGTEPAPGSTEPRETSHRSLPFRVPSHPARGPRKACVPKSSLSSEDAAYVNHYPRAATAPDHVKAFPWKKSLSHLGGVTDKEPREEE